MNFATRKDLTITLERLGQSGEPLLIIDDFLVDPEALVEFAAASTQWKNLPPGGYPGRRAPLPAEYVRALLRRVDGPIREKLLPEPAQLDRFDCSFSMVTQKPSDLTPLQKLPHIDIARASRVAVLHYLCGPEFGGTAFFRQTGSELEQVGPENKALYLKTRAEDAAKLSDQAAYPGAETPGYVEIGRCQARFNRLVAYRSFTLHSGIIDAPERLTPDPGKGRLTANFFVDYKPA